MEAIISDFTGKTVNKKQSYKIQIFSRGSGTHLDIDGSMEDLKKNKIWDSIALALQNGNNWYTLVKNNETKKWDRIEVDDKK